MTAECEECGAKIAVCDGELQQGGRCPRPLCLAVLCDEHLDAHRIACDPEDRAEPGDDYLGRADWYHHAGDGKEGQ